MSAMTKLCVADCYTKLMQVQRDLRNKNGPTKANLADELEPIIAYLKERLPKNNANLLPPPEPYQMNWISRNPKQLPRELKLRKQPAHEYIPDFLTYMVNLLSTTCKTITNPRSNTRNSLPVAPTDTKLTVRTAL